MQTITIDRVTQVTEQQEITLPAYFHFCEFNIHKYYAFLPNDKAIQVNILPGYNDHHKTAVVSLYRHSTLVKDIDQSEPCTDTEFYQAYAEAQHAINAAAGVVNHTLNVLIDDGEDWEQVDDYNGDSDDGWRSRDYVDYLNEQDAKREKVA